MGDLQLKNNAYGTLSASINNSVTTINLTGGHGSRFPSLTGSQFFYATLINTSNNVEIIKVTARSTDALTVIRAQDGTSALAFSANDRLEMRVSKAILDQYYQITDSVNATTVTITDNENSSENNAVVFTAGGDVDGGNLGLESDGDLTYNPSTGRLTATQLAGTLQTAAQSNITSLGTLSTLTVDNVIINGTTIGHTSDTDLITLSDGAVVMSSTLGVTGATTLSSTVRSVGNFDVNTNKFTVNATSGNTTIAGTLDVDGTLEADAITIGGTAIGSIYSPLAGGSSIVATGALDAGSITSNFGAINNGASAITTTGETTTGTLRVTSTTDASNSSTGHGIQIGATNSTNVVIDNNEILSRNNGAASPLYVQLEGGTTNFGGHIYLNPNATIIFEGSTNDSYETWLTVTDPTADRTITLPNATGTVSLLTATETLTNKTLTSPVLNTGVSGTAILDEDDMSTDSATQLATQQSIKAYVDNNAGGMSNFYLEDGDGTEVTINNGKEVKFVEGGGIDINWTDTSTGSDGDPYDLTFTVNAAQTVFTSILNTSLVVGRDADNDIDFGTDNEIIFRAGAADQIKLTDGALLPVTDDDVNLGSSTAQFKNGYFDGTIYVDAISNGGNLTTSGYIWQNVDNNYIYFGNGFDVHLKHVHDTGLLLNSSRQLQFGDSGTYIHQSADGVLDLVSDNEIEINATTIDINGAVEVSGNLDVGGSLETATIDYTDGDNAITIADGGGTTFPQTATFTSGIQSNGTVTVGVDDTGHDVKFFGATSGKYMEWDESANQLDVTGSFDVTGNSTMVGTLTVGVDDTGHDVKFFGATSGKYMEWDESADQLNVSGDVTITSTDDGGPILSLISNDHSDAAAWATEGTISFKADNAANEETEFANITLTTANVTDGDEEGRIKMNLTTGGGSPTSAYQFAYNKLFLQDDNHAIRWNNTRGTNYDLELVTATPTANRTYTLPDATGTVLIAGDNGSGVITTTGVITGGTLEATTDTAAGDNAAIGYTASEGLILTGQGSTSDITIKNDADADVLSIATGTTILTVSDDVNVVGRATGTVTTDNDGNFDLQVSNQWICTPSGNFTLTLSNPAVGQSGSVMLINSGGHTVSAHASIAINSTTLTALTTAGTYMLSYYCSAASGNNTILVSASGALT